MAEMSEVLMHREREFLGYLCHPLEGLDEEIAEECIEILADQLRAKVRNIKYSVCSMSYLIRLLYVVNDSA